MSFTSMPVRTLLAGSLATLAFLAAEPGRAAPGSGTVPCDTAGMPAETWSVMPDRALVAEMMRKSGIQVVDIRSDAEQARGFLPGAVDLSYPDWRGPADNPGEPPAPDALSELIGGAGLDLDRPVLLVHDRDTPMDVGRAAYVYWILKSLGAERLAILRGGFSGWEGAGLLVVDHPVRPRPVAVALDFSTEWRAEPIEVAAIAMGRSEGHLLDARPHGVVSRVSALGAALASTIRGAGNAPVDRLAATLSGEIDIEDGAAQVVAHLRAEGFALDGTPVVSFCNTGELAALNWFYASEVAGLPGMKLYPESIRGWTGIGGELDTPGG